MTQGLELLGPRLFTLERCVVDAVRAVAVPPEKDNHLIKDY